MSVRPILLWPDPRLSQTCAPAEGDVSALVTDLFETMYDAPGRGLAAPQIGVMARVFVTDTTWKEGDMTPIAFINPEIIEQGTETATNPEGCLSIPGILADVTRPAEVTLRWTNLAGETQTQTFTGFAAACVQHELDHLNGTVTFDRLEPTEATALKRCYQGGAQE